MVRILLLFLLGVGVPYVASKRNDDNSFEYCEASTILIIIYNFFDSSADEVQGAHKNYKSQEYLTVS